MIGIFADNSGAEVAATVVLIAAAVAMRILGGRFIRRQSWASEDDGRRWLVQLRTATILFTAFGLVVVWAEQLRTAALSIVAFAAAIVIATREMIVSVSGSIARATSGSFVVGDRIRIGEMRGVVVDHSLLMTTMLEIGPGHVRTGRTVVFPNSLLITQPVVNETRGHGFVLHSFVVPVRRAEWQEAAAVLKEAADRVAEPYLEPARVEMAARAEKYALSMPIVEPFILKKPTAVDVVELTVRLPVEVRDVWKAEYDILNAWLLHSAGEPGTAPAAEHS